MTSLSGVLFMFSKFLLIFLPTSVYKVCTYVYLTFGAFELLSKSVPPLAPSHPVRNASSFADPRSRDFFLLEETFKNPHLLVKYRFDVVD